MPEIKNQRPGVPKGTPPKQESEAIMFGRLADAICALAGEIGADRKQREKEFEWFKSHRELATKPDLIAMERRLTEAITKSTQVDPAVESSAIRLGASLDKLDAQIPDQKTET